MATAAIHGTARRRRSPRLAHELTLVRSAIDLVASGGATRVTLVGLRSGDPLLHAARGLAQEHGLLLRPRWHADEETCDLTVEVDR